jgi:hypothetical protein
MDLLATIAELREERDRLSEAILALERLARETRPRRRRTSRAASSPAAARAGAEEPADDSGVSRSGKPTDELSPGSAE